MPDDPSNTTGKRTGKPAKPTLEKLAAASKISAFAADRDKILQVALESPGSAEPTDDEAF